MKRLIYLLICLFLVSGCAMNGDETAEERARDHIVHVKNTTNNVKKHMSNQQTAQHLADLAADMPNVKDATAVVLGPYAVVGIDVGAKLDRSRVGSIKYTVAESLQHDPYGTNAFVIADPDAYERLKEMGRDIRDGKPLAGMMEELAAIVGRIIPQVPNDVIENENPAPTEQNDNQLEPQEERRLEEEQQDQSNNHMGKQ